MARQPVQVRVWDPFVRIAHWTLVATILGSWFTRHAGAVHEWVGHAALAVIVARVAWGFAGSSHARFAAFLVSPARTWDYAKLVAAGREPRHLGHNPLGGWMVLALLALAAASGVSGWLYTTDRFWGIEWVETTHRLLAWALYAMAGLHLAGVIFTSRRHRENLVAAMFTGDKRAGD
jgi:cytochrome b